MKVAELFPQFTQLVRKYRPKEGDIHVYDVDIGVAESPNVIMKFALFDEQSEMTSDSFEFIISKDWLLENYKDAVV